MIYSAPSASFEAVVQGFPTGLTGTVGVQIIDNLGNVTTARVTAGIKGATNANRKIAQFPLLNLTALGVGA